MSLYTRYDVENDMRNVDMCLAIDYLVVTKNWDTYTPQELFPEPVPANSRIDCFIVDK